MYEDVLAPAEGPFSIEVTRDQDTGDLSLSVDGRDAQPLEWQDTDGQDYLDLFMLREAGWTDPVRFWRDADGIVDILQPNPWGWPYFHRVEQ